MLSEVPYRLFKQVSHPGRSKLKVKGTKKINLLHGKPKPGEKIIILFSV